MQDWLKVPGVAAVGGTWIAKTEDIRAARWDKIAANCREALAAVAASRK
jgi:2-dehydro-3-deoxyphosphogluconate aldolase/(4S)-4-hydroxy-2-oxoglutarate aldolase